MRVNFQMPLLIKSLLLHSEEIITARPEDNNLEPYSNPVKLIRSKILDPCEKIEFSLLDRFSLFFMGRYFSVKYFDAVS